MAEGKGVKRSGKDSGGKGDFIPVEGQRHALVADKPVVVVLMDCIAEAELMRGLIHSGFCGRRPPTTSLEDDRTIGLTGDDIG